MLRSLHTARLLSYRRVLVPSSVLQPLAYRQIFNNRRYEPVFRRSRLTPAEIQEPEGLLPHPSNHDLASSVWSADYGVARGDSFLNTADRPRRTAARRRTQFLGPPYTAAPTAMTLRGQHVSTVCARPFESRWNATTRWSCLTRVASKSLCSTRRANSTVQVQSLYAGTSRHRGSTYMVKSRIHKRRLRDKAAIQTRSSAPGRRDTGSAYRSTRLPSRASFRPRPSRARALLG